MPSFRNAKKQAQHAVKIKLQIKSARHTHKDNKKIHSLGTARNYEAALTRLTQWLQDNKLGDLKNINLEKALHYLEFRGQHVKQKMLDQERQAIQMHLGVKLLIIKSELFQAIKSRAYTLEQVKIIAQSQSEKYRLATEIAFAAGLRAHELLTLKLIKERGASVHRQWTNSRFIGRNGVMYTVIGKGGLIREVLIPNDLAKKLELLRHLNPVTIRDRGIFYKNYYNLNGGKNWTNSFSAASKRVLGWTHGAHGLRHTYAQQRMDELQQNGFIYLDTLGIVSQELGHFRPDITKVYLR